MRGKPGWGDSLFDNYGITPADAGKTYRNHPKPHPQEDHPRGCGENSDVAKFTIAASGSPPRMRGKRGFDSDGTPLVRITPADAGKTHGGIRGSRQVPDHPRGCGENETQAAADFNAWGSPPRMRGKLRIPKPSRKLPRITPADAGKTALRRSGIPRS